MAYLNSLQWKRNRKFGDVKGGRLRPKLSDNIFSRLHSLKKPSLNDNLPMLLEDNPSRNFFHPLTAYEAREAVCNLPNNDWEGITHIWCRRLKQTEWQEFDLPLVEFICGSGVRVIILYPWHKSMKFSWSKKLDAKRIKAFSSCGIELKRNASNFYVKPTMQQLQNYYIRVLLFSAIGCHVDWYNRHWSKANRKSSNDFVHQYAMQMTHMTLRTVSNLD